MPASVLLRRFVRGVVESGGGEVEDVGASTSIFFVVFCVEGDDVVSFDVFDDECFWDSAEVEGLLCSDGF